MQRPGLDVPTVALLLHEAEQTATAPFMIGPAFIPPIISCSVTGSYKSQTLYKSTVLSTT